MSDFTRVRAELETRGVPVELIDAIEESVDPGPLRTRAQRDLFEIEREVRDLRVVLGQATRVGLPQGVVRPDLKAIVSGLRRALWNETINEIGTSLMREVLVAQALPERSRAGFLKRKLRELRDRFPSIVFRRTFRADFMNAAKSWNVPGERWPAFIALVSAAGFSPAKESSYKRTLARLRREGRTLAVLEAALENDWQRWRTARTYARRRLLPGKRKDG